MKKLILFALVVLVSFAGCHKEVVVTPTTATASSIATDTSASAPFPRGEGGNVVFVSVSRVGSPEKFVSVKDLTVNVPPGVYHAISCTDRTWKTSWFLSLDDEAGDATPPQICRGKDSLNFRYTIEVGPEGQILEVPPPCEQSVREFTFDKPLGDVLFGPDRLPVTPVPMDGKALTFGRYLYVNVFNRTAENNNGRYFVTAFPDEYECLSRLSIAGDTTLGQAFVYESRGLHLTGTWDIRYFKEVAPGKWEFQSPV